MPFIITIPLPPRDLSPNARPHFQAKAKAKREYRAAACEEAQVAALEYAGLRTMPWQHVTIKVTYYHKTRAFQDRDNILASLKAAFDGLVDAGVLLDDRDVTYLPVVRGHDKNAPRVELELKETHATAQ